MANVSHTARELIQQFRFWGIQGLVRSFHYSVMGTWARLRRPPRRGEFQPIKTLDSVEEIARGARLGFGEVSVEIVFLQRDLVRFTWQPGTLPVPYAIVREDWPEVGVQVEERTDGAWIGSDALGLEVSRSGDIRVFSPSGKLLREECAPQRRGEAWLLKARLAEDEHLYGLGEHTGRLDLRGSRRRLWNRDPMRAYGPNEDPIYMPLPVLQGWRHGEGYLVFYENSHPATFEFGEVARIEFEGGAPRHYLAVGKPDHLLDSYTRLTGRPAMPPRWAFGYHQSRFSYLNESQVREVADGFVSRGLPISAIHLDIHYMEGFRVFTVDKERFPDFAGLARELEQKGIKLVTILDPGVKRDKDYWVYKEGLERGAFCRNQEGKVIHAPVWPGWSAFPDFTSSDVREWWGRNYRPLVEAGIAGFWNDMNEPALVALWGERTLARSIAHAFEGRGGDHSEAHNLYGLLMVRAGAEGIEKLRSDRRPFLLTRSGWAGIQRHAWMWTGDISSDWPMLRQTISTVLGLGLSGMPYSGPDIGGFKGVLGDELYLRWFELAAFLPFFRTHSSQSTAPREPWRFSPDVFGKTSALLHLRQELTPYLYTLAHVSHRTGAPLVRPLFWVDPHDERLRTVDDAFLLGEDVLVAPVVEKGARQREVILPTGLWYDFWTGDRYREQATVEAPLGRPPVFVRAGAVLPRAIADRLVLQVFAPEEGTRTSQLYSDEGDGYGTHRLDLFELEHSGRELTLRRSWEGDFPFPYPSVALRVTGMELAKMVVDDQAHATQSETEIELPDFRMVRFVGP